MRCLSLTIITLLACADMQATGEEKVTVGLVASQGVDQAIGTVTIAETTKGPEFTSDLRALSPDERDFHVHTNGSYQPVIKDGKALAAGSTDGHYDSYQTDKHEGPKGAGHMGDLSPLMVNNDGNATTPVAALQLKVLDEVRGKALMIHVDGDNTSDQPKPLGGGGAYYACGVIRQSTAESIQRRHLFEL